MSSKKILVTGGMGFVGSYLVDELLQRGHQVRIFDCLDPQVHTTGEVPDYANPDAEFIQGDVRDYDAFKKALDGMEIVFHQAAAVGMGQSQYEIKKYVDINTGGTANMLDILVNNKHKVEKMIVAASQTSYGEGLYKCQEHGIQHPGLRPASQLKKHEWEHKCPVCSANMSATPTSEDTERICYAIYAQTKTHQEDLVLNIGKAYKIPAVALRYFNIFGPRQSLSNPYTGVGAIFMSRLKNGKRPVIYEDGKQSRDFISVHDIVQANMLAMENPNGDYQAFNVGSGKATSIEQIALTLSNILGVEHLTPEIVENYREGDTRHSIADISHIKDTLGFKPNVTFENGMEELVEWAREEDAVDGFAKAQAELQQRGLTAKLDTE
ncbi:MAG: NAD-dependent epimerase/dehydratase family protein [Candidatus Latescibacteria bacterium]|jgi:dTDP-L-rhamnose 4-epimerase|nr:NAD-dependent epimerase/dehydratase family protein [Candidatus Latescibacterota bacterium]